MIARTMIIGAVLGLVLCLAVLAWTKPDKFNQIKPGMTADQVQALVGQPSRIVQSETADQNLTGEVDYYPASKVAEYGIVYVHHTVFKTEFVSATYHGPTSVGNSEGKS